MQFIFSVIYPGKMETKGCYKAQLLAPLYIPLTITHESKNNYSPRFITGTNTDPKSVPVREFASVRARRLKKMSVCYSIGILSDG